jgi:hypothetical protein
MQAQHIETESDWNKNQKPNIVKCTLEKTIFDETRTFNEN